jgi:hypothetical protein
MSSSSATRKARHGAVAFVLVVGVAVAIAAIASANPASKIRTSSKKAGGGPAASAFVVPGEVSLNVSPVLVAARTQNVVAVTEPAIGLYCLKTAQSIDPSTRSWVATPESSRSSVTSNVMFAYVDAAACAAGAVGGRTFQLNGSGAAVPSEHVVFMLVSG